MNHCAIQNILARAQRDDSSAKRAVVTGLVVQGGGMRGTYSMGALMALEECGLGQAFDHVVAASAGAINAAYLLARQAKLAVSVYLDDLSNRRFVDYFRLRRIVDIDYLVDGVITKHKALDVKEVLSAQTTLHIVLTEFETGRSVVRTNRDVGSGLVEAMRATAAMPLLYGKDVSVCGVSYVDGGVSDAVPLEKAIDLGCTDILVVVTRPLSFRRRPRGRVTRCALSVLGRKYSRRLRARLISNGSRFNRTMEFLSGVKDMPKGVRVAVVSPSDVRRMASTTMTNRARLLECALMGRNDTRRALGFGEDWSDPFVSTRT